MAIDARKNFAKGVVSTGYDASVTVINLSAGHAARFPVVPFNAVWWNSTDYPDPSDDPNVEIVRVTGVSTDTLTIARAQESTVASTKNTGSKTYKLLAGISKKMIDDIEARGVVVQVAYAATIVCDCSQGSTFEVAPLTGPLTIGNPPNPVDGQVVSWILPQDSLGSRAITLGSKFRIPTSATTPLAFSTAPSTTDLLAAKYRLSTDKWTVVSLLPGI